MRIFLTGTSGFIGSHVARRLLEKNVRILALVRPGSDNRRIKNIRGKLEFVEGTIENCAALKEEIVRFAPEMCIHLAWQEPGKSGNDENDKRLLAGSLRLVDLLRAGDCSHFMTAGTYVEYCSSPNPVSEDSPTCPQTFYAKSKYELEDSIAKMQQEAGKSFCSVRIFNVYGPGDGEWRLIPKIIDTIKRGKDFQLQNDGKHIRDYIHVEDVADAICRIAEAKLEGIVNVGSSVPSSVASVAGLVAEIMGRPELLKLGDKPSHEPACLVANTSLLRRETDWTPKFELRMGIEQTVRWYLA